MMASAYLLPHGAIYLSDLNRAKQQNGEAGPAPAQAFQQLRKYALHIRLISLSPQQQQKPASTSDLCDSETLEPWLSRQVSYQLSLQCFLWVFLFRFHFSSHVPFISVTTCHKCNSCNRCYAWLCYAVTSVTPNFKNFFKKLKGKKNIIVRCIFAGMRLAHLACAHIIYKFLYII